MNNNKKTVAIDAEGFVDFLKEIVTEPPIRFNPDDFEDKESFENDTDVFMQGYNAAMELIIDMLLSIIINGDTSDLTS